MSQIIPRNELVGTVVHGFGAVLPRKELVGTGVDLVQSYLGMS